MAAECVVILSVFGPLLGATMAAVGVLVRVVLSLQERLRRCEEHHEQVSSLLLAHELKETQ